MTITPVVKNEFFTYFSMSVAGKQAIHREFTQIWNWKGYAIQVQGPDWQNGYNGFAKRHLLATEGGKHAGVPGIKAFCLNMKRAQNPAQARQKKLKTMVESITGPQTVKLSMKDPAQRNQIAGFKAIAEQNVGAHYKTDPYGPNTPLVTVIIMDGMTKDEVANAFVDAIVEAGPWNIGQTKTHLRVEFKGKVWTVLVNQASKEFDAMQVSIHFENNIYYVFHCDGGVI